MAKIIFEGRKKGYFPGGYLNPLHPVYKAQTEIGGEMMRIYEASKKYPGLFTTDGKQHYYASETGPKYVTEEELTNDTWKKYVE